MDNFQNKKILIMGLGLHGGGVAVANWFLKQKALVKITDLKTEQELAHSLKKIKGKPEFALGGHDPKDFAWADIVIQNPGVPRDSIFLQIARTKGSRIENEATLFFKIIGRERIIGVTGTRGKSTTATLIFEMLRKKYKNMFLGGNLVSAPMFSFIDGALKAKDPVVLELSSWHLENLGEMGLSPRIAVFTNLYPDHLNRYKNMEEYALAKQNIFKFQAPNDYLVVNWDNPYTLVFGRAAKSKKFWFSMRHSFDSMGSFMDGKSIYFFDGTKKEKILDFKNIKIKGDHNVQNILAATCVARILEVSPADIHHAVASFNGLEHRLELVREYEGVKYYNDTSATTPDGTIAALKTLGSAQKKNIILIAGGSDKGIPQEKFSELGELVGKHCKAVILFEGKGSEKIKKSLTAYGLQLTAKIKSMSDAVGIAKSLVKEGDIALLSPACASFGLFKHEFDRGDQFRTLVLEL